MTNVEDVRSTGPGMTHWVIKGPLGVKMEFDAQTTTEEENSALAWNSLDGNVQTSGRCASRSSVQRGRASRLR
jgi:uncharacterized membrane protein